MIQKIIRFYHTFGSFRRTAKIFNVSSTSVHRWVHKGYRHNKRKFQLLKLTEQVAFIINNTFTNDPFITIKELKSIIKNKTYIRISDKTLSKYIHHLHFSKKKVYHKCNKMDKNKEEIYKNKINELRKDENNVFIFIDESYFSEKVLPRYGYSKKGKRLQTSYFPSTWKQKSLLCAVYSNGIIKYNIYDNSINTKIFETFINQLHIQENEFILLDNVAFHRAIKNSKFIFTPPYCPQYNPIENCFSIIKPIFRKNIIKNEHIIQTIHNAIKNIHRDTIFNIFKHLFVLCS